MPIFILSVVLQVALVVHIVKTGRNTIWIWIVVMLPLSGSIAYLIVEVFPGLGGSRVARKARRNVEGVINPNKGLKSAVRDLSMSDSVENNMRLAEECMNKGIYQEAKGLYEKSLRGIHKNDPKAMSGLARSVFSRSHAPAWECIGEQWRSTVWVPTEDRGNQKYTLHHAHCDAAIKGEGDHYIALRGLRDC